MKEGLNRVTLLGNLGADPELRMTSGGQAMLRLRLATAESYLDKNNTRQERTEWHSITVWGKRGEALGKFLAKGMSVYVEGSLRTSSYEKDGEKRYRTEVIATNVIVPGNGKGGSDGGGGSRGASGARDYGGRPPPPPAASKAPSAPKDDYDNYDADDDIPF